MLARASEPPGRLDFADPDFQTRPWALYEWYRRHDPVHWSAEAGAYFVFGHGPVREALAAPEFAANHPFRRSVRAFGLTLLDQDGDRHRRLRSAMAPAFRRPRADRFVEEMVDPLAREFVADLLAPGGADRLATLISLLPMRVVCRLLGLPETDSEWLHATLRPLVAYVDHAPVPLAEVVAHRAELVRYLTAAHEGAAAGGLLATLLDDPGLTEREALANLVLLLAAGTETTSAALAGLLARLATQPGLLAALADDPGTAASVVAESLRIDPPLHWTLRFARPGATLAGKPLEQGAPVQICVASANRDPAVYREPELWDPGRAQRPVPLTFGAGRHACLGMSLAKAELEAVVRELAAAKASIALAPDAPPPTVAGRTFRVPQGLRLRTARPATAAGA